MPLHAPWAFAPNYSIPEWFPSDFHAIPKGVGYLPKGVRYLPKGVGYLPKGVGYVPRGPNGCVVGIYVQTKRRRCFSRGLISKKKNRRWPTKWVQMPMVTIGAKPQHVDLTVAWGTSGTLGASLAAAINRMSWAKVVQKPPPAPSSPAPMIVFTPSCKCSGFSIVSPKWLAGCEPSHLGQTEQGQAVHHTSETRQPNPNPNQP